MARETVHGKDQVAGDVDNRGAQPLANGAAAHTAPEFADPEERDAPGFVSPQQFYREATQREDIKRILDALAK
jgi:hypothetical protein